VSSPEEALDRARAEAERKRAEGVYPPRGEGALAASVSAERPGRELISDWAVLRGDPEVVYSTRRLGAPVTAFKRLLLRLMRQYLLDLEARQTRFNVAVLDRLDELERRVRELERER
jgi:hypothetical protein